MDELKECPICHCPARLRPGRTRRLVWVECTNDRRHTSKAYLVNYDGVKRAIANWNNYEGEDTNAGTERD